ncbi:hypothetical protein ACFO25_14805 [Paenactinomyces guangxiensis]|uniref:Uncharacterized protein n=1 Tax=Paenactinomyces guangxiensis TaxID=1490290 RepID=A0A7W1WQ77_9BACL|nr:hypothetical protein [Paenactinomyces guangxiensis]MBA4493871.1 hypothetical protein [Paenactinomyces guangxiensis]MBH8591337.1 hypothetical protein [Paenactinomyces guangxiensis]
MSKTSKFLSALAVFLLTGTISGSGVYYYMISKAGQQVQNMPPRAPNTMIVPKDDITGAKKGVSQ